MQTIHKISFNKKNSRQPLKTYLYSSVLILLTAVLFFSCKKNEDDVPVVNTPLVLTTSDSVIVLNEANKNNTAITFNWTTGSNHGTSAAISYTLQIDKKGNNFSNPITLDEGKGVYSFSYTVNVLNTNLLNHWNSTPGTATTLEARIIATTAADGIKPDTSATIAVTIIPYKAVSTTLYLVGDATPNGWDFGNATPLTLSTITPGLFTYTGTLSPGDFKFITTLNSIVPSYNKGADNGHIILRSTFNDPDNKFHIDTAGVYQVSVNLISLTITYTKQNQAPYSKLWIVGDATPNGWDINNPNQMTVDPNNPFVFKYNEVLKAGEFKIPVATGNWGGYYYMPLVNHPPITATGVQLANGSNTDLKWQITTPGAYKISLDLLNMAITIKSFTPYTQLWMVGDATPNGWNIDNPNVMTKDASNPYVFTYSGPLSVGEFKIPIAKGDWGTDFFRPYTNHPDIAATTAQFVAHGAGKADTDDYKWYISTAGNYTVTFDQLHETISIKKQ